MARAMSTAPGQVPRAGRSVGRFIVICTKILLIVVLLIFAVIVDSPSPKPRLAAIWLAGRSSGCSFADSVHSQDFLNRMVSTGDQFWNATRMIQKDASGLALFETPRGRYWSVANDRFLRYTLAEQEMRIYGSGDRGARTGDVVLDCGANVGAFTRTALAQGARLVVAIEPTPKSVECLRRNFQPEIASGRVLVYPKGVWDREDVMELAEGDEGNNTGNSFILGRDAKTKIKVPLTTIDNLVAELRLERVDFIKMDIEGAEKQALRGATGTIRKFRPRMAIASEHLPGDPTTIPKVVHSIHAGYKSLASSCKDEFWRVEPEVLLFAPN